MPEIVSSRTALQHLRQLLGFQSEDGTVHVALACSEPIAYRIVVPSGDGNWYFYAERIVARDCSHIGPQGSRNGHCGDCDVEAAESQFQRILHEILRMFADECFAEDLGETYRQLLTGITQAISERETLKQFALRGLCRLRWRGPTRYADLCNNLNRFSEGSDVEPGGRSAVLHRTFDHAREIALNSAHFALCLRSSYVRFFSPISRSSLSDIPFHVASEICSVCRWFDRQVDNGVRRVNQALRRACRPLGDFKIRSNSRGGYIQLVWKGRHYCLLRYEDDVPSWKRPDQRAPGCAFRMLDESEKGLQREIAQFEQRMAAEQKRSKRRKAGSRRAADGQSAFNCLSFSHYRKIVFSARRFSRPNPYLSPRHHFFPEDHPPLLAHFGATRNVRRT
jgi:hypothetical protein